MGEGECVGVSLGKSTRGTRSERWGRTHYPMGSVCP
ncbi:hypothetical protein AVEN_142000-1, partial [Araneus ventricosus]